MLKITPRANPPKPTIFLYRVSQEDCEILRESVPYVELYRYNPKHLYPKLNGYGDNGQKKCGQLAFPRTVRLQLSGINLESAMQPPFPVVIWLRAERTLASFTAHELRPTR